MNTPSKRLESLKKKKEQFAARIQVLEAAEQTRENKKDTRRKFLIGTYIMNKTKKNGTFEQIVAEMDSYLTRNSDRALFDLPETT